MRGTPGDITKVNCKMCNKEFETKFAKDGLPEQTRCNECSKKIRGKRTRGLGVLGMDIGGYTKAAKPHSRNNDS